MLSALQLDSWKYIVYIMCIYSQKRMQVKKFNFYNSESDYIKSTDLFQYNVNSQKCEITIQ